MHPGAYEGERVPALSLGAEFGEDLGDYDMDKAMGVASGGRAGKATAGTSVYVRGVCVCACRSSAVHVCGCRCVYLALAKG